MYINSIFILLQVDFSKFPNDLSPTLSMSLQKWLNECMYINSIFIILQVGKDLKQVRLLAF